MPERKSNDTRDQNKRAPCVNPFRKHRLVITVVLIMALVFLLYKYQPCGDDMDNSYNEVRQALDGYNDIVITDTFDTRRFMDNNRRF